MINHHKLDLGIIRPLFQGRVHREAHFLVKRMERLRTVKRYPPRNALAMNGDFGHETLRDICADVARQAPESQMSWNTCRRRRGVRNTSADRR